MILVAVSPLTAALILLLLDRYLGAHFFDTQAGGSAVLWQHFFWIFGHPEVYVLMLPGFGFAVRDHPGLLAQGDLRLPGDGRRRPSPSASSASSVWAHHMFAVGMSPAANTFFAVSTGLVAVPTGIKIFNWLAHDVGGQDPTADAHAVLRSPFLVQFLIAGMTGMMLAAVPFNWQLTDYATSWSRTSTSCWSAHSCSRSSAAIYYWYPKATGRMLSETAGEVALLAVPDRVPPHVHPSAFRGHARHAPAGVHLPAPSAGSRSGIWSRPLASRFSWREAPVSCGT